MQALTEQLIQLRLHVEAAIDFPEEEIDFLVDEKITTGIIVLENNLAQVLISAQQGQLLHDGMVVVLAGRPNAGKSSLLNALAQHDAAIVSDIPGTTRDVLREFIQLDGMPLHVVDTAGLRVARDDIEAEGVRRAQREMARADRILLIVDDTQPSADGDAELTQLLLPNLPCTRVRNKIDLTGRAPGTQERNGATEIALSAKNRRGIGTVAAAPQDVHGISAGGRGHVHGAAPAPRRPAARPSACCRGACASERACRRVAGG